jgi:hypothetical protein
MTINERTWGWGLKRPGDGVASSFCKGILVEFFGGGGMGIVLLLLPLPLPALLLLLLPPPQAATPAPPPLPLIHRRVIFSSRRVLLHPVC